MLNAMQSVPSGKYALGGKTNKLFLFIAVLILSSLFTIQKSEAQWVQMSSGFSSTTIMSFAKSSDTIFAGAGGNWGVYLSTNNGQNWMQTSLNNRTVSCLAINGNNIFAGTWQNYGVYLSTNNGTNWVQTSLNNLVISSLATSGNNIFAGIQQDSGVYLSTNNGTNWTQKSLNNRGVRSLATNGNNIFAGTNGLGVYLSTNNGTNWTQTSLNNRDINALAVNGNNVYAGSEVGVYVSTNNGTNWTQTSLNWPVFALALIGNNIVAGTAGYGNGIVYLSTNNGTNWIVKNQGINPASQVISLLTANGYIFAGTSNHSVWRRDTAEIITSINQISVLVPSSYSLQQNYPNPFNPTTKIQFTIPQTSLSFGEGQRVRLVVFDVLGREVATLVNESAAGGLKPGTYEVDFDGTKYASGVYFYRIETALFIDTKKMILIK